jgi:hypothetical protein
MEVEQKRDNRNQNAEGSGETRKRNWLEEWQAEEQNNDGMPALSKESHYFPKRNVYMLRFLMDGLDREKKAAFFQETLPLEIFSSRLGLEHTEYREQNHGMKKRFCWILGNCRTATAY